MHSLLSACSAHVLCALEASWAGSGAYILLRTFLRLASILILNKGDPSQFHFSWRNQFFLHPQQANIRNDIGAKNSPSLLVSIPSPFPFNMFHCCLWIEDQLGLQKPYRKCLSQRFPKGVFWLFMASFRIHPSSLIL